MASAHIQHLFLKTQRRAKLTAVTSANLLQGVGIAGDLNQDAQSPRQVLVVDGAGLEQLAIAPGELRENIVLAGVEPSQFQPGAKISFASGAALRLTFYCEPCKRLAHLTNNLNQLQHKRGILGVVLQGGRLTPGDKLTIEPDEFEPLPEVPYERFLYFIRQIPPGQVVTYKQILRCIGLDRSYFRVLPLYVRNAAANYPVHRILDSQGQTLAHLTNQVEQLKDEGVFWEISTQSQLVELERYLWQPTGIFQR